MTPPETDPNDPADESPDAPLAGGALVRRRIGMALATLGVLAIVLMWVAAFNGWGSTDSVDQLSDTQWTKQANAVCTKWRDEFDTLPAASDAKTPQDRAASVEDSIDILTDMTDELAALEPPPTRPRHRWSLPGSATGTVISRTGSASSTCSRVVVRTPSSPSRCGTRSRSAATSTASPG